MSSTKNRFASEMCKRAVRIVVDHETDHPLRRTAMVSIAEKIRCWVHNRPRPEYPGHVWAYDFVEGRTHDGRKFRILTIIDEASRECLALIEAWRKDYNVSRPHMGLGNLTPVEYLAGSETWPAPIGAGQAGN